MKSQRYLQEDVHFCGPHLVDQPYLKQLNLQQPIHQLVSCLHLELSSVSLPGTENPSEIQLSELQLMGSLLVMQHPASHLHYNGMSTKDCKKNFRNHNHRCGLVNICLAAIYTKLHPLGRKVVPRIQLSNLGLSPSVINSK